MKTTVELSEPGKGDYNILDDILAMQQTPEYASVSESTNLEYIFDPDKFD